MERSDPVSSMTRQPTSLVSAATFLRELVLLGLTMPLALGATVWGRWLKGPRYPGCSWGYEVMVTVMRTGSQRYLALTAQQARSSLLNAPARPHRRYVSLAYREIGGVPVEEMTPRRPSTAPRRWPPHETPPSSLHAT